MPKKNKVMLSNEDALRRGHEIAKWKLEMASKYFTKYLANKDDSKEVKKYKNDIINSTKYDYREFKVIAALSIDMDYVKNLNKEDQEKYYMSELEKLDRAFTTWGNDGYPIFENIEPYLRGLYNNIKADTDIDWNNEDEIEKAFLSIVAQQAIATYVERMPHYILKLFPTAEAMKAMDIKSMQNNTSFFDMKNKLAEKHPELLTELGLNAIPATDHGSILAWTIQKTFLEADKKGSDTVVFDPTVTEVVKLHWLGEEFAIPQPEGAGPDGVYEPNDAIATYFDNIYKVAGQTLFEYKAIADSSITDTRSDFLLINGRPASELINEARENPDNRGRISLAVGKILRDALLDGNSVVTLTRPSVGPNGNTTFRHQEIKVDLDKLNQLDREENYTLFRRILHTLRIVKIPEKYPSNKVRDAAQAERKSTTEYGNSLKAVEQRFIERYNNAAKQNDGKMFEAIPELRAGGNPIENEIARENEIIRENIDVPREEIEPIQNQDVKEPIEEKGPTEVMEFDYYK